MESPCRAIFSIIVVIVSVVMFGFHQPVAAVDDDGNGIEDDLEVELIEQFKPAFVMHLNSPIEPEPVEIMLETDTGSYLTSADLWVEEYFADGSPYAYQPYCDSYQGRNCEDHELHRFDNSWGWWANENGAHINYYVQMQYGEYGDEQGPMWRSLYLNGGPGVRGPGSDYPPTIYAHAFNWMTGVIVIQYWFFYPYNDWVMNHEGDWEHINVVLANGPNGYRIAEVDYYIHEKYINLKHYDQVENDLGKAHFVDQTHPVVYVGGRGELLCAGAFGSGEVSGASYPAPGDWLNVGARIVSGITLCDTADERVTPGKYISYRDVNVIRIPRIFRGSDDDLYGNEYFAEHPELAWMRANVYWGTRVTDAPGGWNHVPTVAGHGNIAPLTPLYQVTWENRFPGEFEEYDGPMVSIWNNRPALFASALLDGTELHGCPIRIVEESVGSDVVLDSPCRYVSLEQQPEVRIDVPFIFTTATGDVLCFDSFGSSIPGSPVTSVSMTYQSNDLAAIYTEIDFDAGIVDASRALRVAGDGGLQDVLAFSCLASDGSSLEQVRVDLESLGLEGGVVLFSDSGSGGDFIGGDDVWSKAIDIDQVEIGTYSLPFAARDTQGQVYLGEVVVEVTRKLGSFVDRSDFAGPLLAIDNTPSCTIPIDYNGDGRQDILNAYADGMGQLYQNGPGLTFVDVSAIVFPSLTNPVAGTEGVIAADIDNDGDEDLMVSHGQSPVLYRWDEDNGAFCISSSEVFDYVPDRVLSAAWGDYNGDGWVDLAVIGRFDSHQPPGYPGGIANLILYRNFAGRLFYSTAASTEVGVEDAVPEDPVPIRVAWADPNGDGLPDLFFSDIDAQSAGSKIFINSGFSATAMDHQFVDGTAVWFGVNGGPECAVSQHFVDLDNDGDQDLIVGRKRSSDNLLIYENTGSTFVESDKSSWSVGEFPMSLDEALVGDFDLDGMPDILAVPSLESEQTRLLFNREAGSIRFSESPDLGIAVGGNRRGLVSDWLGGEPTVYLAKHNLGAIDRGVLYGFERDTGAEPPVYTNIKLLASGSVNGSGIGAKVEVLYTKSGETSLTTLTKWIDGGSGHGGQEARVLQFGMEGVATNPAVRVTWPDGSESLKLFTPSSADPGVDAVEVSCSSSTLEIIPRKIGKNMEEVTANFYVGADENWWEFVWDTNYPTDDEIEFYGSVVPAGCSCMAPSSPELLNAGNPEVEIEWEHIGVNLFRRTLRWRGRCCFQDCDFTYKVSSKLNDMVAESEVLSCQTGAFCVSEY